MYANRPPLPSPPNRGACTTWMQERRVYIGTHANGTTSKTGTSIPLCLNTPAPALTRQPKHGRRSL